MENLAACTAPSASFCRSAYELNAKPHTTKKRSASLTKCQLEVIPDEYPSKTGTCQLWGRNTRVLASVYGRFGCFPGYPLNGRVPGCLGPGYSASTECSPCP